MEPASTGAGCVGMDVSDRFRRVGAGVALAFGVMLRSAGPLLGFIPIGQAQIPAPDEKLPRPETGTPPSEMSPAPETPRPPGSAPDKPLTQELKDNEGVLKPEPGIDPGIKRPAPVPDPGTTRVIPPPGEPGGNPSIQPR